MILKIYKGRGRNAQSFEGKKRGGLLYRIFMRWLAEGLKK